MLHLSADESRYLTPNHVKEAAIPAIPRSTPAWAWGRASGCCANERLVIEARVRTNRTGAGGLLHTIAADI